VLVNLFTTTASTVKSSGTLLTTIESTVKGSGTLLTIILSTEKSFVKVAWIKESTEKVSVNLKTILESTVKKLKNVSISLDISETPSTSWRKALPSASLNMALRTSVYRPHCIEFFQIKHCIAEFN
jgi:hypothetical protein